MSEEQEQKSFGIIQFCLHCGDRIRGSAKFDEKCSTVDQRREMDRNENANWQEHFKKDYLCKMKCLGGN